MVLHEKIEIKIKITAQQPVRSNLLHSFLYVHSVVAEPAFSQPLQTVQVRCWAKTIFLNQTGRILSFLQLILQCRITYYWSQLEILLVCDPGSRSLRWDSWVESRESKKKPWKVSPPPFKALEQWGPLQESLWNTQSVYGLQFGTLESIRPCL
jgi:hypothetical protein